MRSLSGFDSRFPAKHNLTKMNNINTRLIDLTVGQLAEIIDAAVAESIARHNNAAPQNAQKWLVYGIKGIADLFGVSERQARNIKSSGVISQAVRQKGRTIITDAELALQLYSRNR